MCLSNRSLGSFTVRLVVLHVRPNLLLHLDILADHCFDLKDLVLCSFNGTGHQGVCIVAIAHERIMYLLSLLALGCDLILHHLQLRGILDLLGLRNLLLKLGELLLVCNIGSNLGIACNLTACWSITVLGSRQDASV